MRTNVECPLCGMAITHITGVNADAPGPKNDDRTMCYLCAGVSIWDTDESGTLYLRKPNEEETEEIKGDRLLQEIRRMVVGKLN